MNKIEIKKFQKWFRQKFQTHTDWTGTRVETCNYCDDVDKISKEIIDKFLELMQEAENHFFTEKKNLDHPGFGPESLPADDTYGLHNVTHRDIIPENEINPSYNYSK